LPICVVWIGMQVRATDSYIRLHHIIYVADPQVMLAMTKCGELQCIEDQFRPNELKAKLIL
jgi:hypothetical protein